MLLGCSVAPTEVADVAQTTSDGAVTCPPLTTFCLAGDVYLCDVDGTAEFAKSCTGGESCSEGVCSRDSDEDVVGPADAEAVPADVPADGEVAVTANACTQVDSDKEIVESGETFKLLDACWKGCDEAPADGEVACMVDCLYETLSKECSKCVADYFVCCDECESECAAGDGNEACQECRNLYADARFLECAGLPIRLGAKPPPQQ